LRAAFLTAEGMAISVIATHFADSKLERLPFLWEGVADLVEGVSQRITDSRDGCDQYDGDEAGNEAVLDGGGTRVVADEPC
jgi:hypothetical protein